MRTITVTDGEVQKVMKDRLDTALLSGSKSGAILLVNHKPGLSYAYYRMSAREHIRAARELVRQALRILGEKEDVAQDIQMSAIEADRHLIDVMRILPKEKGSKDGHEDQPTDS